LDIEGAEYLCKDITGTSERGKPLHRGGKFNQINELTCLLFSTPVSYYIKEAANIYESPFMAKKMEVPPLYDIQLNIFCFR
jgi:hypothetical protein